MKISITKSEAEQLFLKYYGLTNVPGIQITVEDSGTSTSNVNGGFRGETLADVKRELIQTTISQVEKSLSYGDKVAAIRAYRTVTGTGLREAKDVVESWEKVKYLILKGNAFVVPFYKDHPSGSALPVFSHWIYIS